HNDAYDQRTASNGGQRSYNRYVVCDRHICANAQEYQRRSRDPKSYKSGCWEVSLVYSNHSKSIPRCQQANSQRYYKDLTKILLMWQPYIISTGSKAPSCLSLFT